MSERTSQPTAGLVEVPLPETTEEEEIEFYRRYRELGGKAIEGYEEKLLAQQNDAVVRVTETDA